MVSNNGEFSVRATRHTESGHLRFYVVGTRHELYIKYDPAEDVVLDAVLKEIDHIDFVSAFRRKAFALSAEIQVSHAEELDAASLAGMLFQLYGANIPDELESDEAAAPRGADPYARHADASTLRRVTARALWAALADSDEMTSRRSP
jgi:hypothetical protein